MVVRHGIGGWKVQGTQVINPLPRNYQQGYRIQDTSSERQEARGKIGNPVFSVIFCDGPWLFICLGEEIVNEDNDCQSQQQ